MGLETVLTRSRFGLAENTCDFSESLCDCNHHPRGYLGEALKKLFHYNESSETAAVPVPACQHGKALPFEAVRRKELQLLTIGLSQKNQLLN